MKRLFTFCFSVLLLLFFSFEAISQTVTISTGVPSVTSMSSTQPGVTFVITNNNAYSIKLKTIDVLTGSNQNGNTFYLKYSPTSLSGAPTGAGSWTTVATATQGTVTATAIAPMFTNLNFTIPGNTTYRFLVHNSGSSWYYGGATTTPNSFTSGGVVLGRGDYTINGQIVGYGGGTPNYNAFSPRFWCGTIAFESAVAHSLSATSVLAPVNNASLCYNTPVTVTAIIKNTGSNAESNFPVKAYYTSPVGSGTLSTTYSGTLASGATDTVVVGTFTPFPSTYNVFCYTALPNDSLTSDDTSASKTFIAEQPVPTLNAVSDTICQGADAICYVSSGNSNAQFNWYSAQYGGTLLTSGDTVSFTPLTQDTTMYVAIKLGNCESDRVQINAVIGTPPVVNLGNDTSFCESLPLLLDAGNPGGSYLWSSGDTTQTISLTNQSGNYWVLVDKYCIASDTINVNIRPMPFASGISYVRTNNTYFFTPSYTHDVESYLWIFGDGSTSTDSAATHTYTTNVNVALEVKLVVGNSCGYDTVKRTVPTGINDIADESSIRIYPNPANDKLFIQSEKIKLEAVDIINMTGSLVLRQDAADASFDHFDISSLPAGNYILRLRTASGDVSRPLQIVR